MQGEILLDIREFRPSDDASVAVAGQEVTFSSVVHPRAIVITPDCDLLTDYSTRNNPPEDKNQRQSRLLDHIQLCEVFSEGEIRHNPPFNAALWKRIRGNQDERYHTFPTVSKTDSHSAGHPEYFLDFKRMFTVQTEFLYKLLDSGKAQRLGIVPSVWIHQLIQRYFAFHSRVGVPDPADANR